MLIISAYVKVCANYVSEGEREREKAMCFPHIIKHNFVAKIWKRSVDFIFLFTVIYLFGQCRCGFWLFLRFKTFEITDIIWRSDMSCNAVKRAAWNYVRHAFSLKIIAHLRMFFSQSDSSIHRPRSIMNYKCCYDYS